MVQAAEKDVDPRDLEAQVREHWRTTGAYEATRKHRAGGEPWYFIDGPPYATGQIHLGTALNKILKDAVVRFRRMQGYNVRDQPGYDMHGLPIEVKVEQTLGISDKRDVEAMGVAAFTKRCRDFALEHRDLMSAEFQELGVWLDWDHPYMTLADDYIEGTWWVLKRADERGLLAEAERGIHWCPRCETALAEAELEYWDEEDPSVYVKFPVEGEEGTFLVIWTTTPWTLPANNAVAVHPDLTYVKVRATREGTSEVLIVAEDLAESVLARGGYEDPEIRERVTGQDLVGTRYVHPFLDEVPYHRDPESEASYTVLAGEHVTAESTGLVHTATGHGADDFDLGREHGIPPFSPVGPDGRYTEEAGAYAGEKIPDVNARIQDDLEAKGLLLWRGSVTHRYGHCWRCKTPILYRTTSQWFLTVTDLKDRMLEEVDRVAWTPEWAGSARQRDWVEGIRDWCISRQRYWGTPMPVWRCTGCGERELLTTREEITERAGEAPQDLHRPWLDEVTFPCDACGSTMQRVPDVLDVWLDSGAASWAQLGYPKRSDEFDRWFPGRWIMEGLDQTRGWFYTQLAAGVIALDRSPYDSVLMHGFIHDAEGRPMSKSLGNIVSPADVVAEHGVDAFRFYMLGSSAPWDDRNFSEASVQGARRSLTILWNVHVFATTYLALDGYDAAAAPSLSELEAALRPEDRWILSRLQGVVTDVTEETSRYHLHRAVRALETFLVEDLSRWYVRLVRDRTWAETDDPDKQAAYRVLHTVLDTAARLLAPFSPYVADRIYGDLGGEHPTVHMADWPTVDAALVDPLLEERMAAARGIVEAASNARQQAGMKLRWPVREVVVAGDPTLQEAVAHLDAVLRDQMNAKAVTFVGESWGDLQLVAEPVRSIVGPTFRGDAPTVLDAIRSADARELRATLEADGAWAVPVNGESVEVTSDMVRFTTALPDHVLGAEVERGSVYVDTELTPEIEAEGLAREIVRRIQETRKVMDLPVDAMVATTLVLPTHVAGPVAGWLDEVARETRSREIQVLEEARGELVRAWDLEGDEIVVGLTR